MLNRARTVSYDYDLKFSQEIEDYISKTPDLHYYAKLWYRAFKLLQKPESHDRYQKLKDILLHSQKRVGTEDLKTIFTYLENTAKFVFKPGKDYYEELFQLYQIQLEEGIIYYDGFILHSTLRNVVTVGLYLKKVNWVEHFLETHQHKIFPTYKEEDRVFYLCLAMLLFEKNEFEQAMEELNKTKFQNIYFKTLERNLRLKVYFELKFNSLFEDTINSYRKFLSDNRDQIADFFLEANRNFINITYAIYNFGSFNKKRLLELEQKVKAIEKVPEKNWLLQKIESLK